MKNSKLKGADLRQSLPPVASDRDMKWKAEDEKRETEDHVKTLHSAFDILGDKGKMKKVHKLAGRRHKAISSLSDLKLARDAFNSPDDHDSDD